MDNFEKHIRQNRAAFDVHKADRAKLWANIEGQLEPVKPKSIPLWRLPLLRAAAVALLLLGVTGLIGIPFITEDRNADFVSQELQDIDMHYQGLVSYHVKLVESNQQLSEEDKQEFLSFMDELDKEYEELRLEMRNNLDNQLVLQAIVNNYKKRIELIENLLEQLNEQKIDNDDDYGYTL
ncbi:hypothetical protein [Pseudozobellia thermophila]|uniref:Anti-sigma factor n=1 Tax=Pseudozobellia thermophila TaxID=192903 RepID=A0A1M6EUV3_9FLAO|nr:hypothetical protein [Pseudozobellia thermophila]SHI89159.1 hypothetical protein SAMN04488513_102185 [Pseudozobellia thermophila]